MNAIELSRKVTVPNREAKLICTLLANDRKDPSVAKMTLKKRLFAIFEAAYQVEDIEDVLLLAEANTAEAGEWSKGSVEIVITKDIVEPLEDFIEAKLKEKDKDGDGLVNGLLGNRLGKLLARIK